jgi:hypothetical protein
MSTDLVFTVHGDGSVTIDMQGGSMSGRELTLAAGRVISAAVLAVQETYRTAGNDENASVAAGQRAVDVAAELLKGASMGDGRIETITDGSEGGEGGEDE